VNRAESIAERGDTFNWKRFALGLPFRWSMFPFFVAAYFGGQFAGSRLHLKRAAQPNRP